MDTITVLPRGTRRSAVVIAAVPALGRVHCDRDTLLEVETPDIIDPDDINNPQGIPALHAGAISEFGFKMDAVGGRALFIRALHRRSDARQHPTCRT